MNTFIFIAALTLSAISVNDYIVSVMDFLMTDNKRYNLKSAFFKSMISCALWGVFYYLNANA